MPLLLGLVWSAAATQPSYGLTLIIDPCTPAQGPTSTSSSTPATSYVNNAGILGGERALQADLGSFGGTTTGQVGGGLCTASSISQGTVIFQWAGLNNNFESDPTSGVGLNANLSAYDQFQISGAGSLNSEMVVYLRVFDSSAHSFTYSIGTFSGTIDIPFSSFSGIDFANIKAIEYEVQIGLVGDTVFFTGLSVIGPDPTFTSTFTNTATPTNTPITTATNTATLTPTRTATSTPTDTPTLTPTDTSTPTATASDTPTDTSTPSPTPRPTATSASAICAATPLTNCATPAKGLVKLQGNADASKQKLIWKWMNGSALLADFGDPVGGTTNYRLCVYDDGALKTSAGIAEGGTCDGNPCWAATATGLKYKNKAGNSEGITQVKMKEGNGNAKIQVKGKGAGLTLPFPITDGNNVTVQLVKNPASGPECWQTVFPAPAKTNDATKMKFQAKLP